jgi:hypothetical protein
LARPAGSIPRTCGGELSTTAYVGDLEASTISGSSTTTTAYYDMGGQRFAEAVNGALSFLASDALGSATTAFDASGIVKEQVLYAPYGGVRYASGTLPTDYGFTGQRADAATDLALYIARYHDPTASQLAPAGTSRQSPTTPDNPRQTRTSPVTDSPPRPLWGHLSVAPLAVPSYTGGVTLDRRLPPRKVAFHDPMPPLPPVAARLVPEHPARVSHQVRHPPYLRSHGPHRPPAPATANCVAHRGLPARQLSWSPARDHRSGAYPRSTRSRPEAN